MRPGQTKDRVYISSYGHSEKWESTEHYPKHFIEIDGQKILYRTVQQVLEYTDDVWVVGNPEPEYKVDGAHLFTPDPTPNVGNIGFYLDAIPIWNTQGRTVQLFGDAYYTDEAMHTIMTDKRWEFLYFARFGPSAKTLKPFGEGWAASWYPEDFDDHIDSIKKAIHCYRQGITNRVLGWETYRIMNGGSPNIHKKYAGWVEIDDFTEDFDQIEDLVNWKEGRRLYLEDLDSTSH